MGLLDTEFYKPEPFWMSNKWCQAITLLTALSERVNANLVRVIILLLVCAKSHMLSASRWQPHLLHVSTVDRHRIWSMDKS